MSILTIIFSSNMGVWCRMSLPKYNTSQTVQSFDSIIFPFENSCVAAFKLDKLNFVKPVVKTTQNRCFTDYAKVCVIVSSHLNMTQQYKFEGELSGKISMTILPLSFQVYCLFLFQDMTLTNNSSYNISIVCTNKFIAFTKAFVQKQIQHYKFDI